MTNIDEATVTSALRSLLDVADLDTTTEAGLEQKLSEHFDADMTAFRPIINVRIVFHCDPVC
jgi:hypothetical protein